MTYVATFYSHFGAVRFKKACEGMGYSARLMPVPRSLSSSCGTCVRCDGELPESVPEELEQIAVPELGGYRTIYHAEND